MKAFNIQFVNILTRTLITEQDKYLTFFKGQIRIRIVESSDQDPDPHCRKFGSGSNHKCNGKGIFIDLFTLENYIIQRFLSPSTARIAHFDPVHTVFTR